MATVAPAPGATARIAAVMLVAAGVAASSGLIASNRTVEPRT